MKAARHPDPAVCPRCHALYADGRWTWRDAPGGTPQRTCPACLRLEHGQPAGYLAITGAFASRHRDEILRLIDAGSRRAREADPLERLMGVEETGSGLRVTTTDGHLAQSLATALSDAYRGEFDIDFGSDRVVRAAWRRE